MASVLVSLHTFIQGQPVVHDPIESFIYLQAGFTLLNIFKLSSFKILNCFVAAKWFDLNLNKASPYNVHTYFRFCASATESMIRFLFAFLFPSGYINGGFDLSCVNVVDHVIHN